jgi:hypothetical protein
MRMNASVWIASEMEFPLDGKDAIHFPDRR